MKRQCIALVFVLSALSIEAHPVCNTEPALELRNAFIQQFAGRGAARGAPMDTAAREAGCIFDLMAERMSVKAYIRTVQNINGGKAPGTEMDALLPEIKKQCIGRN